MNFNLTNIFKTLRNREAINIFIKYYYSHALTFVTFLLLMYVAFVFYQYDYRVTNAIQEPSTLEVVLKHTALEQLAEKLRKREQIIPSLPVGIRNPFETPTPSRTPTPTPSPTKPKLR